MDLLYFNVIEGHAGWGAEYFLDSALRARGVRTHNVDYRRARLRLSRRLLSLGGRYDGMLVQRGDDFPLEIVRSFSGPKVFLFSELVERCSDADHLFESNLFDRYLVRGPRCREVLSARGWTDPAKVEVFLSSFDPDVFRREDRKRDIDCLFVGSMSARRSRLLAELSGKVSVEVCSAFGTEANALFNRAKVVLNIHAEDYLDTETRVYEVLGSGALLVSERLSKENPFTPGTEYIEVDSDEDMAATIRYCLSHSEEREAVADRGYREAHEKHTFAVRAADLLRIFAEFEQAGAPHGLDRALLARYARAELRQRLRETPGVAVARGKQFVKHLAGIR